VRSRWLAALLNLVPGAGMFYAGRPVAAVACMVLALAGRHAIAAAMLHPLPQPYTAVLIWGGLLVTYLLLALAGWLAVALTPSAPGTWNRGWACVGFVAVALAVNAADRAWLVRPWVRPFRVPSGSMDSTLLTGDFFYLAVARPGTPLPARGSIVAFGSIEEIDLQIVKRLVGLPGDTLEMKHRTLYRNHAPVPEPYTIFTDSADVVDSEQVEQIRGWQRGRLLVPGDSAAPVSLDTWGPFVVPPDSFYVLGDNRDASYDSRYYGFIPRTHYAGRPVEVYYSFDSSHGPLAFLTAIRWHRLGLVLTGNH